MIGPEPCSHYTALDWPFYSSMTLSRSFLFRQPMVMDLLYSFLLFLGFFHKNGGFNIDTKYAIIKEGPKQNSYFGYSVAQHSLTEGTNYNEILVGAPLTTSNAEHLNGFQNTGALYRCSIDVKSQNSAGNCVELAYPDTSAAPEDIGSSTLNKEENKTDMWLGVTLTSSGNVVVGCGHRYKILEVGNNVYGIGMCYLYDRTLKALELPSQTRPYTSPCAGSDLVSNLDNSVHGAFGLCAAGMGLDVFENDVTYGLPGAGTYKGSITWQTLPQDWDVSAIVTSLNPQMDEESFTELNGYLGSSVVISRNLLSYNRTTNNNKKYAVVGAPRDGDNGTVIIFELDNPSSSIKKKEEFRGPQFGASFGHSVTVIDILGDNHPSVLVGAPFYRSQSTVSSGRSRTLTGGAIFIYYNYGFGVNRNHVMITPGECGLSNADQCLNAQFGYSIASLGDVNGDGYHDLAVGAPYYDQGAVFIYSGTKDGMLTTTPSQVVLASQLDKAFISRDLSGFGISLSGGNNVDGQGYNDLLVGAHLSSHAVVLRSKPVVTILGSIKLRTKNIDPEDNKCASEPGAGMPCIQFDVCLESVFADPKNLPVSQVSITYNLTLDAGYDLEAARRVVFNKENSDKADSVTKASVQSTINSGQSCTAYTVYIPRLRDILKPIRIELKYSLDTPAQLTFDDINKFLIMNSSAPMAAPATIDFKKECKTDDCETDIGIRAGFSNPEVIVAPDGINNNEFVFESDKVEYLLLTMKLTVDGSMDPAYEPSVYIHLPPEIPNFEEAIPSDPAISCNAPVNGTVVCSFGKKLKEGSEADVTLKLSPRGIGPFYSEINITANTTSKDSVSKNNIAPLKVKAVIVTDLELLGAATKGGRVKYGGERRGSASITKDNQIGDLVQHTYTLVNSGSGKVSKVHVKIQWPYKLPNDKPLLYMIKEPTWEFERSERVSGGCSVVGNNVTNYNNFEIVEEDNSAEPSSVVARRKREVKKQTAAVRSISNDDGSTRQVAVLNCLEGTAKCFDIDCEFNEVEPNATVRIRITSRFWNTTVNDDFGNSVSYVAIMSSGALSIDPSAKVSQRITNDKVNITTEAIPSIKPDVTQPVPIWVYILAAVGGLLILVVIILIFWKCGFFKRHRPMTYEAKLEKQPDRSSYKAVPQNDTYIES